VTSARCAVGVIERYDRAVDGQAVTLIHQEDAAQALGLDWVDDQARFQDPSAPRDSHRPSAYRIADDAVPNLFQDDRIDYNLALAIDGSFDHRRISAAHLIREAATATQLAWNVERLQAGEEIGERPAGYRRPRRRS
jgi:hypothetical protein